MVDHARFTDIDDTINPTVVGSGRFKQLSGAEVEKMQLREALQNILDVDSYLLADAQDIARKALEDYR